MLELDLDGLEPSVSSMPLRRVANYAISPNIKWCLRRELNPLLECRVSFLLSRSPVEQMGYACPLRWSTTQPFFRLLHDDIPQVAVPYNPSVPLKQKFFSLWGSYSLSYSRTPFCRAWLCPMLLLPMGFRAFLGCCPRPRENGGRRGIRTPGSF